MSLNKKLVRDMRGIISLTEYFLESESDEELKRMLIGRIADCEQYIEEIERGW